MKSESGAGAVRFIRAMPYGKQIRPEGKGELLVKEDEMVEITDKPRFLYVAKATHQLDDEGAQFECFPQSCFVLRVYERLNYTVRENTCLLTPAD